jgi:hypothetical protein
MVADQVREAAAAVRLERKCCSAADAPQRHA